MGGGGGGGKFSKEKLSSLFNEVSGPLTGLRAVPDSTVLSLVSTGVVVWRSVVVEDEPLSTKLVCKESADEGIELETPFPGLGRPGKKGAGGVRLGTAPG